MNGKYCADANIFIECWNRIYPFDIFPSLWKQIALHKDDIVLIRPIYDQFVQEKREKEDPLSIWIRENHFLRTPIDNEIKKTFIEFGSKIPDNRSIKRG